MDNFAEYNEKSVQLYHAIHEYAAAGYSKRSIAKELHCSRNTVTRYLHGDYEFLCRRNYRSGKDQFYDYMNKIIKIHRIDIIVYRGSTAESIQKKKEIQKYDYITRSGIFRFLWRGMKLSDAHKEYLMKTYPQLRELQFCIREFREIYERKSMPLLYIFIDRYKKSGMKERFRFVEGL